MRRGHPTRSNVRTRLCEITMSLGWIDMTILAAYLSSAIGIGLRVIAKTKNLESYLLGDGLRRYLAAVFVIVPHFCKPVP